MRIDYRLTLLLLLTLSTAAFAQDSSHPQIADVAAAFKALEVNGKLQTYHFLNHPTKKKPAGYDGKSHFQGIQPLKHGYMVVSGSGKTSGHLFLLATGPFARNNYKIVHVTDVTKDTQFSGATHAGGIQVIGDYIVVPLEHGKKSKIAFYFAKRTAGTVKLQLLYTLSRDAVEAGAVGITKLKTGHFLLAVGRNNSNIIDFYISKKKDHLGTDPDFKLKTTWHESQLKTTLGRDREFGNYQTLNLFTDASGGVFLIGMHRNTAAIRGGHDWADLFRIAVTTKKTLLGRKGKKRSSSVVVPNGVASITKIAKQHMFCTKEVNFDAGAGIYVNQQGTFDACAVGHWWSGDKMWVNEFHRSKASGVAGWVQMWDDKNFKDRTLRISHTRDIANYKNIAAGGKKGFGDKVSSVKFLIPKGYKYVLYDNDNYRGRTYELIGTGKVEVRRELRGFNDKTSSSRLVKIR